MEPITSLLDAFIKLADRIINIEKAKLQDKQVLFKEIAKPLFDELEPVAFNYMEFFRQARTTISKTSYKEMKKVVGQIQEQREPMLLARIKVRKMADQITELINDKALIEFAGAVKNYFYSASSSPSDNLTRSESFLETLMQLIGLNQGFEKAHLLKDIDMTLSDLEESWSLIVQSYEKLRIYSVTSPKFVRKKRK